METDDSDFESPAAIVSKDQASRPNGRNVPTLLHKVRNERSILALSVADSRIYAGTQGGEILVWSLKTFGLLYAISAHRGAVLSLLVSSDKQLLFSSGGDAIVNVWSLPDLNRIYSIYSTYDVGDVFCVAYSPRLQTVYLGAQNTSIQWYDLNTRDLRPPPSQGSHPSQRSHRFFDSKGPGGASTPRPSDTGKNLKLGGQTLEIARENILQYAHFGYVYCMLLAQNLNQRDTQEDILISGGGDGTVKLWNLNPEDGSLRSNPAVLENGDNSVLAMALDGGFLYTGKLDGDVDVWDLEIRQLIHSINAYDVDVLTVSVEYGAIFTGGANGYAKVFERYKPKHDWQAHDQLILASAIVTQDGKPFLVTGGNDDCVAVWDISDTVNVGPATTVRASNEQLIESLTRLVAFRTVSTKPEYAEDCRRGASFLRDLFKRFGATTNMLGGDHPCNPIVYARFKGKSSGGKKILFYGHYDVVAADNERQKWIDNPFEIQGRDGYIYGRGVTDNKGPVLAALYAIADLIAEQKLETDVIFLIEGEEENGSKGFQEIVRRNKEIIGHIDWILMANSYWLTDDYPCLTYGLRGVIHATVTVDSGSRDLHSGVDGSQRVNEPLKDLVALLAKLTGTDGLIKLPNFYDNIPAITKRERWHYEEISNRLKERSGEEGTKQISTASLQAKWREPSLTIHGFETSGPSNGTIIPHLANAAISLRLVPNQDATAVLKSLTSYLNAEFENLHTSNNLVITTRLPVDPWVGNLENEIYQTLSEAVVDVWKLSDHPPKPLSRNAPPSAPKDTPSSSSKSTRRPSSSSNNKPEKSHKSKHSRTNSLQSTGPTPLYIREGGSIPAIRFLEKEFDAPAAQLPCGQASDNAHLDNERMRLLNLYNSRKIFRRVFRDLPGK